MTPTAGVDEAQKDEQTTATRKIVINRCFGGFGLSADAQRALIGCPHMKLMEPREYFGDRPGWENDFAQAQSRGPFSILVHDGKVVCDEHRSGDARACPHLVEVVEHMGGAANGDFADLLVVEIPADVEYTIEEYDGREWVAEVHRTWP